MAKKKQSFFTNDQSEEREKMRVRTKKEFGERNLKRLERIRQDALRELKVIDDEIEKQKKKLDELPSWLNPFK